MKLSSCRRVALIALALLAGCTSAPSQRAAKPGCGVGGDARGISAGFFALIQDRPEGF